MFLKYGVEIADLTKEMHYAMGFVDAVELTLAGHERTCTSGTDSHETRPRSLHNKGLAIDIRTYDLSKEEVDDVFYFLRNHLDPAGFDTVLEKDHLHIEFDPKGEQKIFKKVS